MWGERGTRGCVETRDWRPRRGREGDGSGDELCVDSIKSMRTGGGVGERSMRGKSA